MNLQITVRNKRFGKNRSAITLLEILLVIVLIVVIVSMAVPNMKSAFANTRLKKGADMVRAEFARARVKAIKTGQTQVFRHVLANNSFLTTAQVSPEDLLETDDFSILDSYDNGAEMVAGVGLTDNVSQLPEGVYFMGSNVSIDERAESRMAKYEQEGGNASSGGWGTPIYFFPDGSTSTSRLIVANQKGYAVSVELRGLTGITRIGSMRLASEMPLLEASQ